MVYAMSDIHGEYDRFLRMLDIIRFSAADHLYIIGDIIDRGDQGVDIALDIMAQGNVTLLAGNHEKMCLATLGSQHKYGAHQLWMENGGGPTYYDLVHMRDTGTKESVLDFFANAPLWANVEVEERKFHLVHGMPSRRYDEDTMMWGRVNSSSTSPWRDVTVIVGHTPTPFVDRSCEVGEHITIWRGDGIIDIDCGCGHRSEKRRLACLRLDDMRVFYA